MNRTTVSGFVLKSTSKPTAGASGGAVAACWALAERCTLARGFFHCCRPGAAGNALIPAPRYRFFAGFFFAAFFLAGFFFAAFFLAGFFFAAFFLAPPFFAAAFFGAFAAR